MATLTSFGSRFQVCGVFDSSDFNRLYTPRRMRNGREIDSFIQSYGALGRLPNVPLRARDTLLAEFMKSGIPVPEPGAWHAASNAKQAIRSEWRGRQTEQRQVKDFPTLVGKLLGVEIEYYPCNSGDEPANNRLTYSTYDGSLGDSGREIRRVTWRGKDGRLNGLLNLKFHGAANRKCGLHVHVDVRHLSESAVLQTYKNIVSQYSFLRLLCPPSRRNNRYCAWCDNSDGGGRYAAVNYTSYEKHGTLEFRCQAGTTDILKIETWALICQHVVKFCSDGTALPETFAEFANRFPEPLRSWVILRRMRFLNRGPKAVFDPRALSAAA